jgi:hypothetical protein
MTPGNDRRGIFAAPAGALMSRQAANAAKKIAGLRIRLGGADIAV